MPVPMDHISMAFEHGSAWQCQITEVLEDLLVFWLFWLSTDRFQICPPGLMDRAIICPTAKHFGCSIPPSANIPAMKARKVTSCSSHPHIKSLISCISCRVRDEIKWTEAPISRKLARWGAGNLHCSWQVWPTSSVRLLEIFDRKHVSNFSPRSP